MEGKNDTMAACSFLNEDRRSPGLGIEWTSNSPKALNLPNTTHLRRGRSLL